ncbi:MAG: isoprenylcysteine carboxylmethyltransferase family protein [Candidatus Lokiarchaeota archaeon]|nr:isoprenylcysteine carboxylmethyltransferase family protein [Candidatus Harpocratesius repetitus]
MKIASIFETITLINLILWAIFPIPNLFFPIFPKLWHALLTGILLLIPFGIIFSIGMRDAGKETMVPSEDTSLYTGIYKYVRHPQTIGEFPMWVIMGLMTNSWTATLISLIFIIIYTPIMIKIEEADLVRRFGEKYIEYQRSTGCLFPKLSVFQKNEKNRKDQIKI